MTAWRVVDVHESISPQLHVQAACATGKKKSIVLPQEQSND